MTCLTSFESRKGKRLIRIDLVRRSNQPKKIHTKRLTALQSCITVAHVDREVERPLAESAKLPRKAIYTSQAYYRAGEQTDILRATHGDAGRGKIRLG